MRFTPVALVCSSMVVAAAAGTTFFALTPPGVRDLAPAKDASGTIESADLTSQIFTLRVKEQPQPMHFSVNEKTEYTLDGASAEAEKALRIGNTATVAFEEASMVASRVDAITPE
ncbi:MAG: hypothetical protein IT431_06610 [Phycisphaerales bacterium]|nr:hypothetical protein [Phycisphaerales bacterium]